MQTPIKKKRRLSPYLIITLSFLAVIVIGAFLLFIPYSTKNDNLSLIDSFFLATSSVTLTGFSPVANLGLTLSTYGKIIVALLIQIGGISIISITVFIMMLLDIKIGLGNRVLVKESLNQNSLSGMVRLIKIIVIITFTAELIGSIVNFFVFLPYFETIGETIGVSIFHSISAFNNSGMNITGFNDSLLGFSNNILFNLNTIILIIIGGLGYVVIYDVIVKRSFKKLSIHSKIVLKMTLILIVVGTVFLKVSQSISGNDITWLQALFHSVSARTGGFNTINLSVLSPISSLILIIFMFIGAGNASTGGGIKVTTAYTLFKTFQGFVVGKPALSHGRKISSETKNKAFVLLIYAIVIVLISTFLILIFEPLSLENALFQSVSAFSTVGLSLGLSLNLHVGTKLVLMLVMFIGRIGALTVLSIWNNNISKETSHVKYVEEKLMIG